ncbi:uncharacterized protein LOC113140689 isoform X2 [Mastacembelus armatus]|uniref:uncharacterized protein LOC113140689 isoform X2 n=1 Tax=Mastacembelus armatus TaxID=205130 RepID=UPI000E45EB91|nr:uncharacterized protein LOC113140689 isoform X2 [Mastacembelus armatus]
MLLKCESHSGHQAGPVESSGSQPRSRTPPRGSQEKSELIHSWRHFTCPANMKKKKKRPHKTTKKEHEKVSKDKACEAFKNRSEFESFLGEMIKWFSGHQQQVYQLFSLSDASGDGSVNAKDFELGLMKLGVPCQQFQLITLTQLLQNNNTIRYQELERQVQRLRLNDSSTEVNANMSGEDVMKRQQAAETEDMTGLERCANGQLLNPKHDRFIRLSVRLIPFESSAAHPGNFEVVLSSRSKVFSLIRIIQDQVGIQTSRLEVFRGRLPTEEAFLPPQSSLEECGFKGGPEQSPSEDTVYYDYRLLFVDCPLLNCDHYFSLKTDSAARKTRYRP